MRCVCVCELYEKEVTEEEATEEDEEEKEAAGCRAKNKHPTQ